MLTVRVTSMLSRTSLSYEKSNVNGGFRRQSVKTHMVVVESFCSMVMVSLSRVDYGVKSSKRNDQLSLLVNFGARKPNY